jgi:putative peptidoglycan lipid II flippase
VGAVGRQYLPVLLAGMLMSSSIVIDQAMAASLGSGDVSVLNYGGKVVAVVIAVVAVSMSTVLFPRFAHLIAAGQLREFMRTFTLYASGIVVLSIPGIVTLEVLSEPLVRLLFERGEFTSEATVEVSRVQMWLLLQIPFYVVVMLGARVLSALDANASVLRISALNVGINVLANYLLMRQFGVTGIAMATPLVFLVAMLATLLAIRARIHEKG